MNESLSLIPPAVLRRAEQLAAWRGFWSPGGLELTYSVAAAMRLPSGASVLDAGCGSGESSVYLLEQFEWTVTAADTDEFALALARNKAKQPGLRLTTLNTDIRSLPFKDAAFDGIFSQGTFFMLGDDRAKTLREWNRVLKVGGVLGIGEPMLGYTGHSLHSPTQITLNETSALLEDAGFKISVAAIHPHSERLWAEFHTPHFDAKGRIRRLELSDLIHHWQDERNMLTLGVIAAIKR